jgi:RecA-family ATPase
MFSGKDLQEASFDEVRFVIPDLVSEGVTLLSGSPKIGKSWMLLGMGIGVSTGGSFLQQSCSRGDVLYLALEDNPRRLQSRLRMAMGGEHFPANLHFDTEWNRFPLGLRELDHLLEKTPYSMIMIDTLEMVRPPRRSNPYEDDYRALSGLRDLASKHRCAFVVVHHNRKATTDSSGEEVDPLERVSGTMGLTGCVDNILVLSRMRNMQMGELYVMGRDIEEQRLTVKLDTYLGLWYVHEKGMEVYVR